MSPVSCEPCAMCPVILEPYEPLVLWDLSPVTSSLWALCLVIPVPCEPYALCACVLSPVILILWVWSPVSPVPCEFCGPCALWAPCPMSSMPHKPYTLSSVSCEPCVWWDRNPSPLTTKWTRITFTSLRVRQTACFWKVPQFIVALWCTPHISLCVEICHLKPSLPGWGIDQSLSTNLEFF